MPACKKSSDQVLLSVCSEVQMTAYGPADVTATPLSRSYFSASENLEWFILLVPAYPLVPAKSPLNNFVCVLFTY